MGERERGPGSPIPVRLPASRETLAELRAGDQVLLSGPVFTARDATHVRLLAALAETGELPFGLEGATLFYAGPTPAAGGRPVGAVGPTTAGRMDAATPALLAAGIVGTIGKGRRSEEVRRACVATGAVYFAAVGGAAALLAQHVTAAETVAYPELGTEALVRLELSDFPAFVAIDTLGRDLYAAAATEWGARGETPEKEPGAPAPAWPPAPEPLSGVSSQAASSLPGLFISLEGGEGVGKSTQLRRLAERLRQTGREVVVVREPGGTPIGDRVRSVLLDPQHGEMSSVTELLLYEASRAQLVSYVIEPALERGAIVLCDRFADSSTAYQGHARGLDLERVRALNAAATGGLAPDVTIVLDLDPAEGVARATGGGADRIEREALAFHERVRAGFLAIAAAEPARCLVIDAAGPADEVSARVWSAVSRHPRVARVLGERAP